MKQAMKVLIKSINTQINTLNNENFKVYDIENPEFFIKEIYYDEEDDNIYFRCEEGK